MRTLFYQIFVIALCLGASGCLPSASDPLEEQREPHFLTGKSRVNSMDYEGAVEAFEKALEVNPRSSSAHFELGLLYEDRQQDFAAAIYHFDRYLKLRPNSDYGEIVKQRIVACKQELARTVSLGPVSQNMQRDLERLADENRDLHQKLDAWQAYYTANAARLGSGNNPPPPPVLPAGQPIATRPTATARPTAAAQSVSAQPAQPVQPAPDIARPMRTVGTYSLKAGDTPASIARKYGIRLDALMAANPGIDSKHLKIGQTLTIPAK